MALALSFHETHSRAFGIAALGNAKWKGCVNGQRHKCTMGQAPQQGVSFRHGRGRSRRRIGRHPQSMVYPVPTQISPRPGVLAETPQRDNSNRDFARCAVNTALCTQEQHTSGLSKIGDELIFPSP